MVNIINRMPVYYNCYRSPLGHLLDCDRLVSSSFYSWRVSRNFIDWCCTFVFKKLLITQILTLVMLFTLLLSYFILKKCIFMPGEWEEWVQNVTILEFHYRFLKLLYFFHTTKPISETFNLSLRHDTSGVSLGSSNLALAPCFSVLTFGILS